MPAPKPTLLLAEMRRQAVEILHRPATDLRGHQAFKPVQKTLALWAADCAEHVLPFFEEERPGDRRPRRAIEMCRAWAATGVFRMAEVRRASLGAHAAAREARGGDAVAAARAAGHSIATAHVPTHAFGASVYGIRAAALRSKDQQSGASREEAWQLRRLRRLASTSSRA